MKFIHWRLCCIVLHIMLVLTLVSMVTARVSQNKLLVLLVDGFRWDYIQRQGSNLDGFNTLLQQGTTAEWLEPVFPTNSLPNYKSLETGLYVESHGVVGNFVLDQGNQEKLQYMLDDEPRWWTEAESFFVTAEKQGIRMGLYNHGGCNLTFNDVTVTDCVLYNGQRTRNDMRSIINNAVNKLENDQLDIAYIMYANVDGTAHTHGINSDDLKQEIQYLSDTIGQLTTTIQQAGNINMIVVSDHGMAEVNAEQVINLDEAISLEDIDDILEGYSVAQIWPKPEKYEKVLKSLTNLSPHLTVYDRRDILERWFFKKHRFIPPIYVTTDPGWYIMHPKSSEYAELSHILKANHGYDNNEQDIMGIFMACGPDFHRGYKMKPFSIVDVYQVICHVTGIDPKPHNGTWSKVNDMLTHHKIHDDL